MLVVLAAATYRIAAIVVGREAAALAAGLALASPVAFSLARQPLIDLSLTALVAVAVAQTLSPRFLGSWKAIAATSVVWGLGLLTKWVFPVFLAGPLTLWISHQTARGSRRAAVSVLVAAFGAALVAAPWYAPPAGDLVARASASASMGTTEGDPAGLSTASLGYYPMMAFDGYAALPTRLGLLLALVVASFPRLGRLRPPEPAAWPSGRVALFVASWLGLPYLVFTLLENKDPRYLAPAAPALATAAAWGWQALGRPPWRRALLAASAAYVLAGQAFAARGGDPESIVERLPGAPWPARTVPPDAPASLPP